MSLNKILSQELDSIKKDGLYKDERIITSPQNATINVNNKEDEILIEISARSFLHSQVRIMVGTLVDIAKGNLTDSISEIINSRKRELAGQTAPAYGLYLKKIEY